MNTELMQALDDVERSKGISKKSILDALEKALEKSYEKNFNDHTNVEISINPETGELSAHQLKTVVAEVEDDVREIHVEAARKYLSNPSLGDVVRIPLVLKNFGRVAAQTARNIVIQKIRDAERETIYEEYADRQGELLNGSIQRVDARQAYVDLGKTEGVILASDQIPGERLEAGDRVKLYVSDVRNNAKGAQVLLSRTHPQLVAKLFTEEVPEIEEGIVKIYSVAREAGSRTKIAVYTTQPDVDPIGACVGYKGARVNAIVSELCGEKMDIIIYEQDPKRFICNALSPSRVNRVILHEDAQAATVIVPDDQLSLAIGKEGQNVRLAARLTSWKIDIKGQTQYDADPSLYEEAKETAQELVASDDVEQGKNEESETQVTNEELTRLSQALLGMNEEESL